GAVGRRGIGHVGVVVAGGDGQRGATRHRAVDRGLRGGAARAGAAQAQVDHFGRVGIGRDAADGAARGPDHRVGDVGVIATAGTQHARRDDLGAIGDAGNALGVVGDGGNGARDVGTVPARVGCLRTSAALASRGPVARIARIAVAAVAVVRHGGVDDEVVAREDVGVEVAVVGDARVEHGHHAAGAVGHVPRLVGLDAVGARIAPLLAVVGVVRGQVRLVELVEFDVFDVLVGGDLAHQAFGLGAVELAIRLHHVGTQRHAAQMAQGQCLARDAGLAGAHQCSLGLAGVGAFGAGTVLDDEAVVLGAGRED